MTYTQPKANKIPVPEKIEPQKKIPPVTEIPKTPPVKRQTGHPMSRIDQALARMQKEVSTKKAEPEAGQVPEGPTGGFSVGNTTGAYVPPNDPEYVLYQMKIRQRIMNQWIIPIKFTQETLGLLCRITVHINDAGEVVQKEWENRSGNEAFDMSAMRAIDRASPLDTPPERLKFEVLGEGFAVEFRPQAAGQTTP
jgi:outer membrane biosynthesis protein TonB